MPQALFDFNANGLTVKFQNLSTDATTYQWDFGDGSAASAEESPEHVYADAGLYPVKLTATKDAVNSEMKFTIVVTTENRVNITIRDMIKFEAPALVDANPILLSQKIKAWQIYLQPLVDEPFDPVAAEDTYSEWKWPSIFNQLIARIVIWELIVGNTGKSVIQSGSTNAGGLKSLETGPSKAEWYDASDTFKNVTDEGGILETLTQELCMVAFMAGIQLPMCPTNLFAQTDTFIVGKKTCRTIIWPISKG